MKLCAWAMSWATVHSLPKFSIAVRAVTSNFVMGNHDAAAVGMMDYSIFNAHARQAIKWTMEELDSPAKEFLSSVPLAIEAGEVLFVHAEIAEPGRFDYINDVEIAAQNFAIGKHFVTFVGHTHLPKVFEEGTGGEVTELADDDMTLDSNCRYIVNVGSVGEPRNPGDLRARYGVYDTETRALDFRRIEFDIVAFRSFLEATTLAMRPFFLHVYEQMVEGQEPVAAQDDSLVDMQVAHDSAALVDLGQVSDMGHLTGSKELLESARPSRALKIILAVAAAVALFIGVFWAMRDSGDGSKSENIARKSGVAKEVPSEKKKADGLLVANDEPQNSRPEEMKTEFKPEVVTPPVQPVSPKPQMPKTVVAKSDPDPPPIPKPEPPKADSSLKLSWWRMDAAGESGPLVDSGKKITLALIEKGKKIRAIAPDPIPLNQEENKSALKIGIWQEEKPSGEFVLGPGHSFTFEGWFFVGKLQGPVFLLGTRTGEVTGGRGWHLDLRPPERGRSARQMSFFYDSGQKKTQALAEEVWVADKKSHHFAVVWDHDYSVESGEMRLFLDGVQVASNSLPHEGLSIKQSNPFRVGAKGNPAKLALDELRFSHRALAPHEFLLSGAVVGVRMIKSDEENHNSWLETENWEEGKLPSGDENVIIDEGVTAQVENRRPLFFSGSLVLKEKSTVILWRDNGLSLLPKAPSKVVLYQGARLILETKNAKFGSVELLGTSEIWGGYSIDEGPAGALRVTRQFVEPITGPGKLIINGVSKNTIIFEAPNTFTGGMEGHSTQKQGFKILVRGKGNLGRGDVTIGESCSLIIEKETRDVIKSDATLSLEGGVGSMPQKFVMNSNESVGAFVINGKDQGVGKFSSKTHKEIGGSGELTVKGLK